MEVKQRTNGGMGSGFAPEIRVRGFLIENEFKFFNSYAWGMADRRRLTFKAISRTFFIVQSCRPKMFIPAKNTFTSYVLQ